MDTVISSGKWSVLAAFSVLWQLVRAILYPATVFIDAARSYFPSVITFVRVCWIGSKFPVLGKPLPVLGHLFKFITSEKSELVRYCITASGETPVGVAKLGFYPLFYITDPRDMEKITSSSSCNGKSSFYELFSHAVGYGILTTSGEQWQSHRKIIDPTFHRKVIDSYSPCINKHADLFIEQIRKNINEEGKVDVFPLSQILLLRITAESLLNSNFSSFLDPQGTATESLVALGESILERGIRPWLYPESVYLQTSYWKREKTAATTFRSFTASAIENRVKQLNSGIETNLAPLGKTHRRFLDQLLIAEGIEKSITLKDVDGEVTNVLFAGIETTSITLGCAIYELARNPEIQNRLLEELESLYDTSLQKIEVTPADINQMPYMDMVVKETLRLHNPVPMILREVAEDVQLASCDLKIPAGAQLVLGIHIIHMNPEFYPNPDEFNPENFLPENENCRHPYTFIPFSAGARSCIGKRMALMELKGVLAKIVWELELLPEPSYVPHVEWGLTMKPVNGVIIRTRDRRR